MTRRKLITAFSLGALAIAVAIGAVAYRSATAAPSNVAVPSYSNSLPMGRGVGGMKDGGGYTNEDLANALGISVDDLTAAYKTAREAAIQQAVDQGLITQAQADQLSADGAAYPFGGRWEGWLVQNGIDFDALLASALGITTDQLQVAFTQAYNARIDQAVADGKLTQEQADLQKGQHALYADKNFQASMQTAYESAVKQAVADGVITQAQADLILENQNNMGPGGMMGLDGPHGLGPDGGRGVGPHARGGTAPDSQDAPTTPQAQS